MVSLSAYISFQNHLKVGQCGTYIHCSLKIIHKFKPSTREEGGYPGVIVTGGCEGLLGCLKFAISGLFLGNLLG